MSQVTRQFKKHLKSISPFLFISLSIMAGTVVISTTLQAQTTTELSRTTVETSLSNGLKVIIREDHRSPVVMTQIWYGVGSSDESGNLLGISHALEHMMFKGTTKVPHNEFTRLSRIYGGSVNASTFTNYTNYYQLYPKSYLPLALELEADRMTNLVLKQEDFEPEIKVIM